MRIVVCIKQVPETRDVEVDPVTGVLKRDGVDSIINPYDLYALEAAIRLQQRYGGEVIVVSMGPPQAETVIKEAYMMGADSGVLLSDRAFAGADTLATAYTLAQGIRKLEEFDLILCGMQTTDGDTAQVGPGIAEFLNIPHEAYVEGINEVTGDCIHITRDMGQTVDTLSVRLPALIAVTKAVNQPRLLSYRRKLQSRDWPVTVWQASDLQAEETETCFGLEGSPTQVERIFPPDRSVDHVRWEGSGDELAAQLVAKLRELKFT